MSYYIVKLKWLELKGGTDATKKVSKNFVVDALSVTEAEIKINGWIPANYQDAFVEEVKKTPIASINIAGSAENFWLVKSIVDNDGREKPKPIIEVYNGLNIDEVLKIIKDKGYMEEIQVIQKFNAIIDSDLVSVCSGE